MIIEVSARKSEYRLYYTSWTSIFNSMNIRCEPQVPLVEKYHITTRHRACSTEINTTNPFWLEIRTASAIALSSDRYPEPKPNCRGKLPTHSHRVMLRNSQGPPPLDSIISDTIEFLYLDQKYSHPHLHRVHSPVPCWEGSSPWVWDSSIFQCPLPLPSVLARLIDILALILYIIFPVENQRCGVVYEVLEWLLISLPFSWISTAWP